MPPWCCDAKLTIIQKFGRLLCDQHTNSRRLFLNRAALWQSVFLSAVGRRTGLLQKAMQLRTGAQGQPLSCGFFCNGIAWLPVKDYHLASHILTDAYLLSRKRQLPEHLYTLAPSDSPIGLSIWQFILCPQPPRSPPSSQKLSRPPLLCPGPVTKK